MSDAGATQLLVGSRCSNCDAHYYPPRATCLNCHSQRDTASYTFSGDGTLYSFSTVHVGKAAPVRVGYVDLTEGVRVLARLDPNEEVGMDERVRVTTLGGDGNPTIVQASISPEEEM